MNENATSSTTTSGSEESDAQENANARANTDVQPHGIPYTAGFEDANGVTVSNNVANADEPHDVVIDDIEPARTRNPADLIMAFLCLLSGVIIVFVAVYLRGFTTGVESDAHNAGRAFDWLLDLPVSVLQQLATLAIVLSVLIHMLASKEWVQAALSTLSMFTGYLVVRAISYGISRIGGIALVNALDSLGVFPGSALLPDIYAGLGAFLTMTGPRRSRSSVKWGWNILYAVAVILVIVSWHSLAGTLISLCIGGLVGLLFRFAIGTQNNGAWGEQVIHALRDIGISVTSLSRRPSENNESGVLQTSLDDDLVENSRLYDAVDIHGKRYIVSVLDAQTHAAGYLNQLWQWLRLNGVAMRRDRSAIDADHHHYAMLLALHHIGLPAADIIGVSDYEESSILVFNASGTIVPIDISTISDMDMTTLMRDMRTAHIKGFTHRRITPDTLARTSSGRAMIAGWHNGDYASNATNVMLDRVQLLMLLGALNGVERTLECARNIWGDDELIELTPFIQKAAVPSATRALPTWNKQIMDDLRSSIKGFASEWMDETQETVTLSRFNVRSFVGIVLLIIAVAVIFTQMQPEAVIKAVTGAKPAWAVACLFFSLLAWLGSATVLGAFMDSSRRHYFALYCSQVASGFTAVSMPAGVGPAFVNLQHLRKSGYRNTEATAIMSATWLIPGATTIVLLLGIGVFTGRNTFSGMIPTNTLIVVIGAVVLLISAAMAIAPVRHLLTTRLLPLLKSYVRQLLDIMSQPRQLIISILGSLILNFSIGFGFWAALLAFGYHTNPLETTFVFLLANTLGSAVPTPGGLGAIEAALTFAFTSVGVPAAVALSATLLYRVCFYWLRIPLGALAMKWMDRHNLI